MSEYQYYEFQALDTPLTQAQMDELRSFSTRARITPTSFVNEYNWGSFKGDPETWMEKYFDVFLYVANWGSRSLMFRVLSRLVDSELVAIYCVGEAAMFTTKGDNLILSFHSENENPEWIDGEGWMGSLPALRSDLIRGDYRCLYLGWLLSLQFGELDDDDIEPPVPPGLGSLTAPLQSFADFLCIDPNLIAAAAEQSRKCSKISLPNETISDWVTKLSSKEKNTIIEQLIAGEDIHVGNELRNRVIRETHGNSESQADVEREERRRVAQLTDRAELITKERREKEVEIQARAKAKRFQEEEKVRKDYLESLVGHEGDLWSKADALIATKQPRRYDDAILILEDLRAVADMTGQESDFSFRIKTLYHEHQRKHSLLKRFQNAKLMT